jgi:hypothetical protein
MTLAQQFPDASIVIREKNKLKMKRNSALLFNDIQYAAILPDQHAYDKAFRIFHIKLLAFIVILLSTLFFIILNGQSFWKWISS